jgi:dephospho-CoA kinase
MFRVGLTGGIASGKSTVAELFGELNVPVIDTDEIARDVVRPGQPALEKIAAEFGPLVLDSKGRLDRRRLRNLAFSDDSRRRRLEEILHPRIREEAMARSATIQGIYQLWVVPLLFEAGFHRLVDRVLVVDCPESVQHRRLLARDNEDPEQADRMIAAQIDRNTRLASADDVIDNSGDLADTRRQVEDLHQSYLVLAGA